MANDNLSMRGVTSAASSSSGIDVARLLGKNQSVSGGSADSQFQQVFDSQFSVGSNTASSGVKAPSAASDNSRRSSGNSSPQASDAAQARDAQARDSRMQDAREASRRDAARQNDKNSRAQDTRGDDRRADARRDVGRQEESRKTDNLKTGRRQGDDHTHRAGSKGTHQDERDARNDTRNNAGGERKAAASTEREGSVKTKSARAKNSEQKTAEDTSNVQAAGQTSQTDSTSSEKIRAGNTDCVDTNEITSDAAVEQSLASAKVVDVANSNSLTSGALASAATQSDEHSAIAELLAEGEGRGLDLSVSSTEAEQRASAADLLRALQQLQPTANASTAGASNGEASILDDQGEAIADPGLKDILTAMLQAQSQAGDASGANGETNALDATKLAGKETAAPSDLLATLARELAAARQRAQEGENLPEASADPAAFAVNDPSAGLKSAESLLANSNIPVTSLRMGSETMHPALLEKMGKDAALADTQGNADNGVNTSSGETGSSTKIADALTLLMPSHKSATQTDPANSQPLPVSAAPLTLDKLAPTLDAAKTVTSPVQADQQMSAVREELRNLGKLVDSGLQAAGKVAARETDKDEPIDVKPANLTRAIEDLASVAKASDVRGSNPANNAAINNTPVALGRPNFAEHMAEKILMMTTQKVQTAEIRLDPKELGAVDVKIHVHQDQASVVFSSPHAQVRDALESSIPKLREMFADAGVGLGSVNVNDRGSSAGNGNEQSQGRNDGGNFGSGMEDVSEERTQRAPRESNGLVDFYA